MTDREAIDVLFNEWKCIDRNDGIHCNRKCESCDLVMDVEIIREAFNMAISALESEWEEMIVICDNCGHAIHVKRRESDERSDKQTRGD